MPTYLVPATQKVWADVYTLPVPGCDGKTAAEIFEEAGCTTPAAPSCAACLGGPRDTFARMNEPEVCVSTTNRNFPGRMGHKEGQIYLARCAGRCTQWLLQCVCVFAALRGCVYGCGCCVAVYVVVCCVVCVVGCVDGDQQGT